MALGASTPFERLQPCLFDRLIDENVQNKLESRIARVISLSEYRAAVLRDLSWLMNCSNHIEAEGLAEFPEVESSVFNFGKPSLSGLGISGINLQPLEAEIKHAIRHFEPRIIAETLVVHAFFQSAKGIVLEIRAQLWARPFPEKLFIKTAVDLETEAVTM